MDYKSDQQNLINFKVLVKQCVNFTYSCEAGSTRLFFAPAACPPACSLFLQICFFSKAIYTMAVAAKM